MPPAPSATEQSETRKIPDNVVVSPRWLPTSLAPTSSGAIVAYLLILFGVLFLIAQLVTLGYGVFLLGIGLAFAVARLATRRYGFAVPAGLLLGLGLYVALRDAGVVLTYEAGSSLVCVGLGFLAIYLLGASPRRYWPLIPGAILIVLGFVQIESTALASLAVSPAVTNAWPITLILFGVLVLAREALSHAVLVAIGAVLLTVLLLSAALALGQPTTLSAPIAAGQTLRVANLTGGSVLVIPGDSGQVRATVTKQLGTGPVGPVEFGPSNGAVTLEARSAGSWPNESPQVSLVVVAPRDAPLVVGGSSGDVTIADRAAPVQVQISSGNVLVSRVDGSADLTTSSGSIHAADVTGPFTASASSGAIVGTGLRHPISAQTSSGNISLSGTFADNVSVRASSGSVTLGLAPDSSTRIAVTNTSGGIWTGALPLANVSQSSHQLAGTIGSGAGTLTVQTTSGDVRLDAAR
jgi:hypothetical protein